MFIYKTNCSVKFQIWLQFSVIMERIGPMYNWTYKVASLRISSENYYKYFKKISKKWHNLDYINVNFPLCFDCHASINLPVCQSFLKILFKAISMGAFVCVHMHVWNMMTYFCLLFRMFYRILPRLWPSNVLCSTALTSWTSWLWASSSRA